MSAGETSETGQAFEMGRLVQGFSTMQAAVNRIEGKLDNVATKTDIAEVRTIAQAALDRANAANTRLDGQKEARAPWVQIAVGVITAIVLGAMAILG